jgi:hypothetical protein
MVSVTYNGQATPYPTQVNVAPSAVGIYTLGNSGLGPGAFTGMDGSGKTFAAPATNGETVTAMATGLGAVSGPANALPSTFPNSPGVEVFVGTQAATVTYAGRSTCCVGLDQITFEVPAGVAGCYVPVAVRSGGTISNFVSIAVSSDGGQCSDTAPTIPISVMNQAMAGQSVKAAAFAAGPVPVLQGLGFNEKLYLTAKLSKLLHVKLSQQDVEKLLLVGQTHNRRAMMRAMTKYAAAWKALNPAAKAQVQAALNPNQAGAVAAFGQFTCDANGHIHCGNDCSPFWRSAALVDGCIHRQHRRPPNRSPRNGRTPGEHHRRSRRSHRKPQPRTRRSGPCCSAAVQR